MRRYPRGMNLVGPEVYGTLVAQVEEDAAEQQTGEEAAGTYSPLPTQWRVDEGTAARQEHFDGGTVDTEEQRTDVPSTVERRMLRPAWSC